MWIEKKKEKKNQIFTTATHVVAWIWPAAKLPPNRLLISQPRGTRERNEKAKVRKKWWVKIRSLLGEGKNTHPIKTKNHREIKPHKWQNVSHTLIHQQTDDQQTSRQQAAPTQPTQFIVE